jgi:hypothetical protein
MRNSLAAAAILGALWSGAALSAGSDAPPNAYCYIGWPNDGQVIAAG